MNHQNIVLIYGLTQGCEKTKERFDLHIFRSDDGTCFGNITEEVVWFDTATECNEAARSLHHEAVKEPNHDACCLYHWYIENRATMVVTE